MFISPNLEQLKAIQYRQVPSFSQKQQSSLQLQTGAASTS